MGMGIVTWHRDDMGMGTVTWHRDGMRMGIVTWHRDGMGMGIVTWHRVVSCPDSSLEKWKEGLVFWATFLVTWGRAYGVKNVIFTFYIWDSSFLTT